MGRTACCELGRRCARSVYIYDCIRAKDHETSRLGYRQNSSREKTPCLAKTRGVHLSLRARTFSGSGRKAKPSRRRLLRRSRTGSRWAALPDAAVVFARPAEAGETEVVEVLVLAYPAWVGSTVPLMMLEAVIEVSTHRSRIVVSGPPLLAGPTVSRSPQPFPQPPSPDPLYMPTAAPRAPPPSAHPPPPFPPPLS